MSRLFFTRLPFLLVIVLFSSIVLSGCTLVSQKSDVSGLQITTQGIEAKVLLNGNQVGMTPFSDQTLKPGSYSVRLEPVSSDFAAYETTMTLYPKTLGMMEWDFGQTPEMSGGIMYELQPLKRKADAHFSLASIPDGAIVKIDDVSQGFTPVLLKSMTVGAHRIQVSLPSYKERVETVDIAEGFQMDVTVKLAKQKAVSIEPVSSASGSALASGSAEPSPTATTSSSSRPSGSKTTKSVTITQTGTGWLRVRESASTGSKELVKVDVGKSFPLVSESEGWYQIEYEAGKKGWVSAQYAKKDEK